MKFFRIPGPWVGTLTIGTRPRGGDWLEDDLRCVRRHGASILISLLEAPEETELGLQAEGLLAERCDLQFWRHPIPDRGVPKSQLEAVRFVQRIISELLSRRSVVVHCRQGIGRSGLVAGATLVLLGVDTNEALRTLEEARGVAAPETDAQVQWLRSLTATLGAKRPPN